MVKIYGLLRQGNILFRDNLDKLLSFSQLIELFWYQQDFVFLDFCFDFFYHDFYFFFVFYLDDHVIHFFFDHENHFVFCHFFDFCHGFDFYFASHNLKLKN